jgi:hypothetical protein
MGAPRHFQNPGLLVELSLVLETNGRSGLTSSKKTLIIAIVGHQVGPDTICTTVYPRISIWYTEKYISCDSRRLAPDSNLAWITTECFDILLHPAHSRALVTQC